MYSYCFAPGTTCKFYIETVFYLQMNHAEYVGIMDVVILSLQFRLFPMLVNFSDSVCCAGQLEHGISSGGGTVLGLRHRGAAAGFLEKRGFGWLMEVADDDDEDQKPLLYVFVKLLN